MNRRLTANETSVFQYFLFGLLLASQISKCINDNTKYKVEDDDNQEKEKCQVIYDSCCKICILWIQKEDGDGISLLNKFHKNNDSDKIIYTGLTLSV